MTDIKTVDQASALGTSNELYALIDDEFVRVDRSVVLSDDSLNTTSKEIVGAINEINNELSSNPHIINSIGTYTYNDEMLSGFFENGYYYFAIPIYGFTPTNVEITATTLHAMSSGLRDDLTSTFDSFTVTSSRIRFKFAYAASTTPEVYSPIAYRFSGTITIS